MALNLYESTGHPRAEHVTTVATIATSSGIALPKMAAEMAMPRTAAGREESSKANGEYPRNRQQTCYHCGKSGHYRPECLE